MSARPDTARDAGSQQAGASIVPALDLATVGALAKQLRAERTLPDGGLARPWGPFAAGTPKPDIVTALAACNPRFSWAEACRGRFLAPLAVCADRMPVADRHGVQICAGDRLRVQVCVGRYGTVERFEIEVGSTYEPYGQILFSTPRHARRGIFFHLGPHAAGIHWMRGYHRFDDFEHGHETWAEVIAPAAPAKCAPSSARPRAPRLAPGWADALAAAAACRRAAPHPA